MCLLCRDGCRCLTCTERYFIDVGAFLNERSKLMPGCEKCWRDAGAEAFSTQGDKVEIYHRLLEERRETPCTLEEQCGEMHVVLAWKDGTKHCVCGKVKE